MTFDVPVHDTQAVHVQKHESSVSCDGEFLLHTQLLVLLHVEQIVKRPLLTQLEHDVNIWNFRDHAHQHHDVRVPQNALHHNFVLNLHQQLVRQPWVEYFFDSDSCSVQLALMNRREASLANFLAHFEVT